MATKENKFTGGCLCGAVRYETSEPPNLNGTCNCRGCQRWSGSGNFAFAGFPVESVKFSKGELVYRNSSPILKRGFCATCGSGVAMQYLFEGWDARLFVGIGTLDKPEAVKLDFHFGVESKLPWVNLEDGLHQARADEDEDLKAALAAVDG